ncbi:MAG: SusC/RagA family TonB-linked outer membrane protein [Ignavibacteria bacterium]|nr:SusC/RagA family TonB-linked outer membrane protein [Ignavibacteria bacterium]
MNKTLRRFTVLLIGALALVVTFSGVLVAQQAAALQGSVTDARSGQVLPGANVFIKELQIGSATDKDGNFSFLVPATLVRGQQVTLQVKYVGYKQTTETITLSSGVIKRDFALTEDVLGMQEVVVTGTIGGTFKEKLPFTVDRVSKADIEHAPAKTAESAIRGKVAGVKVVQGSGMPGRAAEVQMRGATSLNTSGRSSGPLYIVDGVILGSGTVDIDALNIENIEVVKGAAAASLYGSRAAAGVVQITTSRGGFLPEGETRVNFRNEYGRNQLVNKISLSKRHAFRYNAARPDSPWVNWAGTVVPRANRVLDTLYRTGRTDMYVTIPGGFRIARDTTMTVSGANTSFKDKEFAGKLYDQIDEFFDPGYYYTNTLTVSHKSRNTNFMASLNNRRESGVIISHEGLRQQSVRLNVDHKFLEGLDLSLSVFHSTSNNDEIQEESGGPLYELTYMPPDIDLRQPNADGQPFLIWPDPGQSLEANPLYRVHFNDRTRIRKRTLGSGTMRWAPSRMFDIEGNFSYDRLDQDYKNYYIKGFKTVNASTVNSGSVYISNSGNEAMNGSLTGSFNYDIGDLSTRSKARYLFELQKTRFADGSGNELLIGGISTLTNVSKATRDVTSSSTEIRAEGYYFITSLDFKGRYIADFLIRRDGSSLFGADARWQTYYRASAAWRLAQEPWWFFSDYVNEMKLRYSIGTAGTRPAFAAQYEVWNLSGGAVSKGTLGNAGLKPEFSTEQEFGFDVGVMDRVLVEVTYSNKVTKDQIDQAPLLSYFGYPNQWKNIGTVETNTLEASLKAFLIQGRDVSLSATVLFDQSTQKITELNVPAYRFGPDQQSGAVFYMKKDETLGAMYGRKWLKSADNLPPNLKNTSSAWQVNDDGYLVPVGDGNSWRDGIAKKKWGTNVILVGSDGIPYTLPWGQPVREMVGLWPTGNDWLFIGNAIPDFNLAFNTTFRYKGFTAYLLFDAQIGGEIYNLTRQWAYRDLMHGDNDQIGKTDETKKPLSYYSTLYSTNLTNSHFVEDGTYLKLRELSIRYSFDRGDLAPIFGSWVNRVTIGVIGRNLFTWTDYTGYDPEVGRSTGQGNATLFRFDGYYYPNYRNISGSLEIEF